MSVCSSYSTLCAPSSSYKQWTHSWKFSWEVCNDCFILFDGYSVAILKIMSLSFTRQHFSNSCIPLYLWLPRMQLTQDTSSTAPFLNARPHTRKGHVPCTTIIQQLKKFPLKHLVAKLFLWKFHNTKISWFTVVEQERLPACKLKNQDFWQWCYMYITGWFKRGCWRIPSPIGLLLRSFKPQQSSDCNPIRQDKVVLKRTKHIHLYPGWQSIITYSYNMFLQNLLVWFLPCVSLSSCIDATLAS